MSTLCIHSPSEILGLVLPAAGELIQAVAVDVGDLSCVSYSLEPLSQLVLAPPTFFPTGLSTNCGYALELDKLSLGPPPMFGECYVVDR